MNTRPIGASSRRFFSEMDGIHSSTGTENGAGEQSRVVVLATTNVPWDLDDAMRRRLEKRICASAGAGGEEEACATVRSGVNVDASVDISAVAAAVRGTQAQTFAWYVARQRWHRCAA